MSADIDGNFQLLVPKSNKAIVLEIHYTGYSTLFHSIVPDATKTGLILEMNGLELITEDIVGLIIVRKKEHREEQKRK